MITSLVGLAVLLDFIIQNRMRIKIRFLFWHFIWPLWVYTIVIAVFGALAWLGLGVVRRHRRRKARRGNRPPGKPPRRAGTLAGQGDRDRLPAG